MCYTRGLSILCYIPSGCDTRLVVFGVSELLRSLIGGGGGFIESDDSSNGLGARHVTTGFPSPPPDKSREFRSEYCRVS